MSIDKLKTKFITGAFINDVKHYFSKINEIIDWINNIGTPSYKVYTALLTQTGTNAPTVDSVQVNTLGSNVSWSYSDVGEYQFSITPSIFTSTKTIVIISTIKGFSQFTIAGGNFGKIYTFAPTTGLAGNNILSSTSIEIRVYN